MLIHSDIVLTHTPAQYAGEAGEDGIKTEQRASYICSKQQVCSNMTSVKAKPAKMQ